MGTKNRRGFGRPADSRKRNPGDMENIVAGLVNHNRQRRREIVRIWVFFVLQFLMLVALALWVGLSMETQRGNDEKNTEPIRAGLERK